MGLKSLSFKIAKSSGMHKSSATKSIVEKRYNFDEANFVGIALD